VNCLIDLDGTLVDPRIGITKSIQHALRSLDFPVPPEQALLRFIGPPLQLAFSELLNTKDRSRIDEAVEKYRERYREEGLFENTVYDGIPKALAALQDAGARLVLATSKPHVFARQILEHFHLSRYFDAVHGSELDGTRADKTALISHILENSGMRAADTMMIGDRKHDAVGATANGVRAIGVLLGYGSREELLAAGCQRLLEQPEELARCGFDLA